MRSMMGEPFQSVILEGLPPMAVPMTVKIPDPMTMPTPRAVSETGPRDFLRECSGRSESEMSLSMDLVAKIWRGRCEVLVVLKIATIVCGRGLAGESGRNSRE
jgi:hypothetical protein